MRFGLVQRFLKLTKSFVLLLLLSLRVTVGAAGSYLPPVENTYVTATFLEYRSTGNKIHLHTGVDFSTFLREGVPIRAASDGFLVRLEIETGGLYGNTVVLEHGDGYRTLYAHLQRFSERTEALVKLLLDEFGKERIVVEFSPGDVLFARGETVGYSGRTGQALQPHCHFEVRDREERFVVDPLSVIDRGELKQLRSNILIRSLVVNGVEVQYTPNATYQFKAEYPEISVEAYTELAKNLLGVKELKLYFSDELVYHIILDRLPLSIADKANLLYDERSKMSPAVYRAFYKMYGATPVTEGSQEGISAPFVRVNKVAEYRQNSYSVRLEVKDDFGNVGTFTFKLVKAR